MKKFIFLFPLFIAYAVNAQHVAINNTAADADASAALDISCTTKGFLFPRMTATQRNAITSPASGLFIFNTTTNGFEFYNSSWRDGYPMGNNNMANADSTLFHGNNNINTFGTITSGIWNASTIALNKGGTSQTTANAALNALMPSQTSNGNNYIKTDGSGTLWANTNYRTSIYDSTDFNLNGTSWTTIPGLNFNVTPGTVYRFSANIPYVNIGATGDVVDFSINGPGSPTFLVMNILVNKSATDIARGTSNAYDTGINPSSDIVGSNSAKITGMIIASSSGSVVFRAKSSKNNKHTIKAGAMVEIW